jgi:hypothetical protein
MTSLGFENYAEVLKIYLAKYRQVCSPFLVLMGRVIRMLLLPVDLGRGKEVRVRDWMRIL